MPSRRSPQLPTSAELRVLGALWHLGEATVDEVVNYFPAKKRPNYKTTQAFLRIMEQKGFVQHSVRGRVFVFQPLVSKFEIDQGSVRALLQENFGGSAQGLFLNLLESDAVPAADLDALEGMIAAYREKKKGELTPE